MYDLSFDMKDIVKTIWGDKEAIIQCGAFTGCETDAVIYISSGFNEPSLATFLEAITRAKQFLAIITVCHENKNYYEEITKQLRLDY